MTMTTPPLTPLFIDSRVGSSTIMDYHPFNHPTHSIAELSTLPVGDFFFLGHGPPSKPLLSIVIELKSIFDFMDSLRSGRLQAKQLVDMLVGDNNNNSNDNNDNNDNNSKYDLKFLLLYGRYRPTLEGLVEVYCGYDDKKPYPQNELSSDWKRFSKDVKDKNGDIKPRGLPYSYVQSRRQDISSLGIIIDQVDDKPLAALWVAYLYNLYNKPWNKRNGMHVFDNSGDIPLMPDVNRKRNSRIYYRAKALGDIPGIGYTKAITAAKHFPSFYKAINASLQEWQDLVGDATGRKVWQWIREEWVMGG